MIKLFVSAAVVFESYLSVIERFRRPTREHPEITDNKIKLCPNKVHEAVLTGTFLTEPERGQSQTHSLGVNFLNNVFDVNLRIWLWEGKYCNDHRTAFADVDVDSKQCLDGK
jgi:hypothetical protein